MDADLIKVVFIFFLVSYTIAFVICLVLRRYHPVFVSFIPFANYHFAIQAVSTWEHEKRLKGIKKSIMDFEIKGDVKNGR